MVIVTEAVNESLIELAHQYLKGWVPGCYLPHKLNHEIEPNIRSHTQKKNDLRTFAQSASVGPTNIQSPIQLMYVEKDW